MSFYVTIPSNSSLNVFDNTISDFTTQLHIPISLSGPYEVALVEFSYDHYWTINIGKLFYYYNSGEVYSIDIIHTDGEPLEKLFKSLNHQINLLLIQHEIKKMSEQNPQMPNNQIKNKVLENFMKKKIFHDEDNDKLVEKNSVPLIRFNSESNEIICNTINENDNFKITGHLADLLNLSNISINSKSPPIKITEKFSKGLFIINSLYIYTDIISYQYVGDTLSPLLRNVIIPSTRSFLTESVIYNSPHYVPVNKTHIDTINIKIKDEQGNNIRFERGKSIVKLHFRPIRYGL